MTNQHQYAVPWRNHYHIDRQIWTIFNLYMKIQKLIDLQATIDLVFKKDFKNALSEFSLVREGLREEIPPLLSMELDLIEAMIQSQIEVVPAAKLNAIRSWSETDWTEFDSPLNSIATIINAGVVLALTSDFKSAKQFFSICSREIGRYYSVAPTKYLLRNLYHLALTNKLLQNDEEGLKLSEAAYEVARRTVLGMYPTHPEGMTIARLKNHYGDSGSNFSFWFELGSVPIQLAPRS